MTGTINDQFDNPISVGDTVKVTALDASGGAYLAMSQATWTVVSLGRTRAKLSSSAWSDDATVAGRCLRIIETGDGRSLAHTADSHWEAVKASLRGSAS